MSKVGICGIGASIPARRLKAEETISNWNNSSADFVTKGLGVLSRAVLASDEDVVTLATEASKKSLKGIEFTNQKLESVFFGTTTSSELFGNSII